MSVKDNQDFDNPTAGQEVNMSQTTGDGAYIAKDCCNKVEKRDIQGIFPPRMRAKIAFHGSREGE